MGGDSEETPSTPTSKTSCPYQAVFTQEVDPLLIKHSLDDRIAYLTDFLGFTTKDSDTITKVAPFVNDMIPSIVDSLYAKLFEFDITKKVFMSRNQGFDGPLPKKLEDLSLDSPQLVFRKVFMRAWARRVLTADYTNGKTWAYMDKVGIMHTGASPFKHQRSLGIPPLNVPYRDCALTLGLVQNILQTAILRLPAEKASEEDKIGAVTAINKVPSVLFISGHMDSERFVLSSLH